MRRHAVVWVAGTAVFWMLVWAGVSGNASADDRGGRPHVHIRGKLTTADGKAFQPPSATVQVTLGPRIFPGLPPNCSVEGAGQDREGRAAGPHSVTIGNDGSYELVVTLRPTDRAQAACDPLMGSQNIAVDRTQMDWRIPGVTVSAR